LGLSLGERLSRSKGVGIRAFIRVNCAAIPASLFVRALKRDRSYRSDPAANFGWVILVHVEEVSHRRFHSGLAGVVWSHGDDSPKDLEQPAIPILHHVMVRGKARVDECFQVLPDRFASMPFGNAKIANCIFHKAVEAFAEGLVIDFFPER
jgi:hypothetical protein